MVTLGVNIDHIATLRQARVGIEPEPNRRCRGCAKHGATAVGHCAAERCARLRHNAVSHALVW